ncbi:MAG: GAF domain-containing protein [Anaerolineae bacterium]|nr:GAF domain-containing protein [Anaerolineae bacterium]
MSLPLENTEAVILRPEDIKAVYAIGLAIAQTENIDSAMDLIVLHTRHVLIFDNLVLYTPRNGNGLDPSYARVVGRGKNAEGEIEWGGKIANQAYTTKQTALIQEKLDGWENNRLFWRDFLGLPLKAGEDVLGVLVFGRFGGPPYTPDQIRLAEFIAAQTAQLVENHHLVERVSKLEAERWLRRMQDDFITTISHELRTPIGFIKGYATTLLRDDTAWDDNSRREFLTIIDEEADRLHNLIEDLLDSARLKAGTMFMQLQPVRIDMMLREIVVRSTTHYSTLSVQLRGDHDVVVMADPTRITQVFDNLLSNAVKYAPGSEVLITLKNNTDNCVITVEDHGPGIAEEHLGHLFERFYRVPETRVANHGTGLGLYIVQEIIHGHGGEITVSSVVSQGTNFTITLPTKFDNLDIATLGEEATHD